MLFTFTLVLLLSAEAPAQSATPPQSAAPAPSTEAAPSAAIQLPKPQGLEMPVGEALLRRHSARSFDPARPPTPEQVSTLLWAAAGITRPDPKHPQGGKRTAPSAFGSASIDVYMTSAKGTFLYAPKEHALVRRSEADLRQKLGGADWAKQAPCLFIFVADYSRYPERTSQAERRDYSFADAAAAGENFYLAATALRLGTVLTMMSSSPEAEKLLELAKDQKTVFAFPVGYEKPSAEGK